MRAASLMWAALAIVVGVSLFLLKYKVQALETELAVKRAEIVRDRAEIRVLDAEWTYLNSPERLRRLSGQYLGLGAPKPQNVTDISALPFRAPAGDLAAQPQGPSAAAPTRSALSQVADARTSATPSLSVMPVFARLQRYLLPAAAEATPSPALPARTGATAQ